MTMGAGTSKLRPGKSMRVATIFTGVAAATVGVTQVANAQDAAHPAARQTSKHIGRAIRPAGRYDGSIRVASGCGERGIDKTWLHVSTGYSITGNTQNSWCFGGKGAYISPPGLGINVECGGNNHGYLMGLYSNGNSWNVTFGPGTTYRVLDKGELQDVTIYSWTGKDTCPPVPGSIPRSYLRINLAAPPSPPPHPTPTPVRDRPDALG